MQTGAPTHGGLSTFARRGRPYLLAESNVSTARAAAYDGGTIRDRSDTMIPSTLLGLVLTLGPYTGPPLNGSVPDTAKFAVDVRGVAGEHVQLRTIGVPPGYIASFCTNVVCAPFSVSFALPASGHERIELQIIANDPAARKPRRIVVGANDRVRASIAFSRAAH